MKEIIQNVIAQLDDEVAAVKALLYKFLVFFLSFFPLRLPMGMTEFETFVKRVFSLSKVPLNDSTRFTLAFLIMHLGSTEDRKPIRFFVKSLNKYAANQVADAIARDMKDKQQKRIAEEAAAKAVANGIDKGNSTSIAGVSDGPVQQPEIQKASG